MMRKVPRDFSAVFSHSPGVRGESDITIENSRDRRDENFVRASNRQVKVEIKQQNMQNAN